MSSFFIQRPIVAIVISILLVVGGAVMIFRLPVAQFPEIAPPQIETTGAPKELSSTGRSTESPGAPRR